MNIYTLPGKIVKCTYLNIGTPKDTDKANKHLKLNEEYTVLKSKVEKLETKVWLEEINNIYFSPLHFANVTPQSSNEDRKHPDYINFNRPENVLK